MALRIALDNDKQAFRRLSSSTIDYPTIQ